MLDPGVVSGAVQAPSADDYGGGIIGTVESWTAQAWNNLLGVIDDTLGDPNVVNGTTPSYDGSSGAIGAIADPIENAFNGVYSAVTNGSTWVALAVVGVLVVVVVLLFEVKNS